jgi:hypothetical protein
MTQDNAPGYAAVLLNGLSDLPPAERPAAKGRLIEELWSDPGRAAGWQLDQELRAPRRWVI